MAKPVAGATPLRWATAPLLPGDRTDPDGTHKDQGWQPNEEPPHSYFNYWMNLAYLWFLYLAGLEAEALTWTAAHIHTALTTFNAATDFNGPMNIQDNVTWKLTNNVDVHGTYNATTGLFDFSTVSVDTLTAVDEFHSNGPADFGDTVLFEQFDVGPAGDPDTIHAEPGELNLGGSDLTFVDNAYVTSLFADTGGIQSTGNIVSLGQVSGTTAEFGSTNFTANVDVVGTLTAPVIARSGVTAPTLTGGYSNLGGGHKVAGYWKDPIGIKHLQGMISRTAAGPASSIAFTLPTGFEPEGGNEAIQFPQRTANGTDITITIYCAGHALAGQVEIAWTTGASANVSLNGITFR